jgi:hypothetical protein
VYFIIIGISYRKNIIICFFPSPPLAPAYAKKLPPSLLLPAPFGLRETGHSYGGQVGGAFFFSLSAALAGEREGPRDSGEGEVALTNNMIVIPLFPSPPLLRERKFMRNPIWFLYYNKLLLG